MYDEVKNELNCYNVCHVRFIIIDRLLFLVLFERARSSFPVHLNGATHLPIHILFLSFYILYIHHSRTIAENLTSTISSHFDSHYR